ncbi:DUF6804 family protein [Microbacterium invictum]|uniref:Uncharacterized protein n=1 Tax=Microbacterium invictum TaxID=515415 RepID=A0AA40VNH7_9MICO|nr:MULTISPECIES: DUF6804 family protein [Microbacterium]MBB4141376.1 hypothetical protein [Microbacterium invictum]
MSSSRQNPPLIQRNALAPGLLAAIALFLSPLFADGLGATIIRFVVAILALIVAWFAAQAKQWWWTVVFVAVAVVWNPVYPFEFSGGWWIAAQIVGAVLFLLAGALIKTERPQ